MTKRWRGVLLLLGVFTLGGVVGGALTHAFARRDLRGMMSREGFEQRRLQAMARFLDLTDEQRARVEEILARRGEERRKLMDTMYDSCAKPMDEHRRQTDDEIRAVLTDEQKPKFEKMLQRRRPPHDGRGPRH
ncbi:MAG: hypothetical protein R3B13_12305 [Polyangiaceae bacterium]